MLTKAKPNKAIGSPRQTENRRYAQVHARTVARLVGMLTPLLERAGIEPPFPTTTLAELILAIGSGVALERVANPAALPSEFISRFIGQIATSGIGKRF
jgi:hypothetical protein